MDNFLTRKLRVLGCQQKWEAFLGSTRFLGHGQMEKRGNWERKWKGMIYRDFLFQRGFHVRCFSDVKWQATPEEVNCKGLPGCRTVPFVFSEDFVRSDG